MTKSKAHQHKDDNGLPVTNGCMVRNNYLNTAYVYYMTHTQKWVVAVDRTNAIKGICVGIEYFRKHGLIIIK